MEYFAKGNTPVYKFTYSTNATSGVAFWTPSASGRVAITDLIIGLIGEDIGTFQVKLGSNVVFEGIKNGTGIVSLSFETPIMSETYDEKVYIETQKSGKITITGIGFEIK